MTARVSCSHNPFDHAVALPLSPPVQAALATFRQASPYEADRGILMPRTVPALRRCTLGVAVGPDRRFAPQLK
jgi:hypothetical protein